MPTSGPHPIIPRRGFFPWAHTMIDPTRALRFQHLLGGAPGCGWDNASKVLDAGSFWCGTPLRGKPCHVWRSLPAEEAWATISGCIGRDFRILPLDLPTGSGYTLTIGDGTPLTIHTLFRELWAFYSHWKAYSIRYDRLWTSIIPSDLLHDYEEIHFTGWP